MITFHEQAPKWEMTTREGSPTQAAPKFDLGVLFVHGIGTQRSGETLVHWGDVLLKTVRRATLNKAVATIERAGPGVGPGNGPFEAEVQIRAENHTERWLLSEGWWADTFPPPSYRELVSWSVRAVPWSIATHIAQRYWLSSADRSDQTTDNGNRATMVGRAKEIARLVTRTIALVKVIGQLLAALALAPLLVSILALALLVGLLPIPQIRSFILAAQSTLTATVGDCLVFVESPIRAALIRTCIIDGLQRLKQVCERTVIVAHSQGAAAVLDALGGIVEEHHEREAISRPVPNALVTFGAGTNQLAAEKALTAGVSKELGWNPASGAVASLSVAAGLSFWLYWEVRYQQITVQSILWGFLMVLTGCIAVGLAMQLVAGVVRRRPAHQQKDHFPIVLMIVVTAVISVLGFLLFGYGEAANLPIASVGLLFVTLVMIGVSAYIILSSMENVVTAPVRTPPGLDRWVDLYASADPVPNGRTRKADTEGARPESIEIWNLGSPFADHTAYWDNLDGFVLRIVRECAQTARSEWKKDLPGESDLVDRRAAWRVGFLRMARWSTGFAWLALGAILWNWQQAIISALFDPLPVWISAEPIRFSLFVAFIALAMWVTLRALRWPWHRWVRAEQEAVLAHNDPESRGKNWRWFAPVCMATVVWVLIFATFFLTRTDLASLKPSHIDLSDFPALVISPVSLGFCLYWLLLKLSPSPKASGLRTENRSTEMTSPATLD